MIPLIAIAFGPWHYIILALIAILLIWLFVGMQEAPQHDEGTLYTDLLKKNNRIKITYEASAAEKSQTSLEFKVIDAKPTIVQFSNEGELLETRARIMGDITVGFTATFYAVDLRQPMVTGKVVKIFLNGKQTCPPPNGGM